MKSFIVYDSEGFILRTGSCVDSDLEMQAGDNEFVMEGIADDLIHMIIDGKVCNQPEPDQPTDAELILIVQASVACLIHHLQTRYLPATILPFFVFSNYFR